MRKSDVEVREVVCSETGKPMPKIPLWMADVNVKFVSDEARQKHSSSHGVIDEAPPRIFDVEEEVKETDDDAESAEEAEMDIEEELDTEEIEEDMEE